MNNNWFRFLVAMSFMAQSLILVVFSTVFAFRYEFSISASCLAAAVFCRWMGKQVGEGL